MRTAKARSIRIIVGTARWEKLTLSSKKAAFFTPWRVGKEVWKQKNATSKQKNAEIILTKTVWGDIISANRQLKKPNSAERAACNVSDLTKYQTVFSPHQGEEPVVGSWRGGARRTGKSREAARRGKAVRSTPFCIFSMFHFCFIYLIKLIICPLCDIMWI